MIKLIFASLIGFVTSQETIPETCTKDAECTSTENDSSLRCATMTMEGFSVDQCVASILCGEIMEIDGVKMEYWCFDNDTDDSYY